MSCTVIAVPYALAWVIGAVATAAAGAVTEAIEKSKSEQYDFHTNFNCDEEVHTITAEHFMEKDFETPFIDKEILIKTLEEHGVININADGESIYGSVEGYNLNFTRSDSEKPFSLRITSATEDKAEEKISDLNSEYALNVQEDAYLSIIEKLKENNMEIEDEVVEDDNTIVLTVNLEN